MFHVARRSFHFRIWPTILFICIKVAQKVREALNNRSKKCAKNEMDVVKIVMLSCFKSTLGEILIAYSGSEIHSKSKRIAKEFLDDKWLTMVKVGFKDGKL